MHSRVFQLSETQIHPEDFLKESDITYEDGLPVSIADYIQDSYDRDEDIVWLIDSLNYYGATGWNYNEDTQGLTFTKDFIVSYFKNAYEEFKAQSEKLSVEDFAYDNGGVSLWRLEELLNKKYGFYVYQDGCYKTFDSFVRSLKYGLSIEPSVTYYIGGTLDYHA